MLGVLLCGGKSSRMGTDKALLTIGNKTWLEIALELFNRVGIQSVVSCHKEQLKPFSSLANNEKCIVDNTSHKGPINGILSTHQVFPQQDLLVLACDMPYMEMHILTILLDAFKSQDLSLIHI